eukprot:TRINITY_DN2110_c0_g1_i1.p1 TRINITY_DN2110_c0_g1~~TRINITY_DN2110_c0_g1_i1.p1  ORF type:complete len:455 (+),score=70.72 TRINITY_DN2110_c0_g1_i1:60-1424(+)
MAVVLFIALVFLVVSVPLVALFFRRRLSLNAMQPVILDEEDRVSQDDRASTVTWEAKMFRRGLYVALMLLWFTFAAVFPVRDDYYSYISQKIVLIPLDTIVLFVVPSVVYDISMALVIAPMVSSFSLTRRSFLSRLLSPWVNRLPEFFIFAEVYGLAAFWALFFMQVDQERLFDESTSLMILIAWIGIPVVLAFVSTLLKRKIHAAKYFLQPLDREIESQLASLLRSHKVEVPHRSGLCGSTVRTPDIVHVQSARDERKAKVFLHGYSTRVDTKVAITSAAFKLLPAPELHAGLLHTTSLVRVRQPRYWSRLSLAVYFAILSVTCAVWLLVTGLAPETGLRLTPLFLALQAIVMRFYAVFTAEERQNYMDKAAAEDDPQSLARFILRTTIHNRRVPLSAGAGASKPWVAVLRILGGALSPLNRVRAIAEVANEGEEWVQAQLNSVQPLSEVVPV